MRTTVVPLLMVACFASGCPTSRSDSRGTLSGRVVLQQRQGLDDTNRVTVDIGRGEGSTVPDADGNFEFSDIEPDTYEVRITYAGGLTAASTRSGYEPYVAKASVRAGGYAYMGELNLVRAKGTVTGSVNPPGGVPVEGEVVMTLEDGAERREAIQDNGFTFEQVPVGSHSVSVRATTMPAPLAQTSCQSLVDVTEAEATGEVAPWPLEVADVSLLPGAGDLFAQEGGTWHLGRNRVTVRPLTAFAARARMWLDDAVIPAYAAFDPDGWVLTDLPNGRTLVHAQFRDGCAYESPVYTIELIRDVLSPVVTEVKLASGNAFTTTPTVSLVIHAVDDLASRLEMRTALCALDRGGAFICPTPVENATWQPYQPVSTVTFDSEQGGKGVQVQLRDRAGNVSTTALETVELDSEPPVVTSVTLAGGATVITSTTVNVAIVSSGATQMQIGIETGLPGVPWQAFAANVPFTFPSGDGEKQLVLRLRDDAGNVTDGIERTVTLNTKGRIEGAVTLEDNASPAGAQVSLRSTMFSTVVGSDGLFSFTDVPAGAYTLEASPPGELGLAYRLHAVDVIVSPLTAITADLRLARTRGGLSGQVTLEGQTSHHGILVQLVGSALTTATDTNGAWALADVATVTFGIRYSRTGFASHTVNGLTVSTDQTTTASDVELLELRGTLIGKAVLEGRTTHAGATIRVVGSTLAATSGDDGSWTIPAVRPGTYSLQLSADDYETQLSGVVGITGEAIVDMGETTLVRKRGGVGGVATLEGAVDHAGTVVELLGSIYRTTTDSAGRYELRVPVGNYDGVRLSRPRYAAVEERSTITVATTGVANQPGIQLRMIENVVSGRVTRFNVTSAAGIRVELLGIPATSTEGMSVGNDIEDPGGAFSFPAIPLGDYRIRYSYPPDPDWEAILRDISVRVGPQLVLPSEVLRELFVKINDGAAATTNPLVRLTLGASDCSGICVGDTPCPTTGPWAACRQDIEWTLPGLDGVKTVYVRFKDSFDRVSDPLSDTIVLDRVAGILDVTHDATGPIGRGGTIHFRLRPESAEAGGSATVSIAGFQSGILLYDDGTHGDVVADDAVYETDHLITDGRDVDNAVVTGFFVDRLGNVSPVDDPDAVAAGTVTIAVPPSLVEILAVPDSQMASATISVTTDESTTAVLEWGSTSFYGATLSSTTAETTHVFILDGLELSTEYHYRLEVKDQAGHTTRTADRSFWVRPLAPVNVLAMAGDGRVDLAWAAPSQSNITGYVVLRATGPGGPFVALNASAPVMDEVLLFSDTSAANGTVYRYVVRSLDDVGNESADSTEVSGSPAPSTGGTDVGGRVSVNTIWTTTGSPYRATGNVLVEFGVTLRIAPGVVVSFAPQRGMQVDGELIATGTATAPVTFGSSTSPSSPGDWSGLAFSPSARTAMFDLSDRYVSGSLLSHVAIVDVAAGVVTTGTGFARPVPYLRGSAIRRASGPCLALDTSMPIHIRGGALADCGGVALVLRGSASLEDVEVSGCPEVFEVVADASPSPGTVVIRGNVFLRNGGGMELAFAGFTTMEVSANAFIENNGPIAFTGNAQGTVGVFSDNLLTNNAAFGLNLYGGVEVRRNAFRGNAGVVMLTARNMPGQPAVAVHENDFENPSAQYEVAHSGASGSPTLDATGNWWGTTSPPLVEARILDWFDDTSRGIVSYAPVATSPNVASGQ